MTGWRGWFERYGLWVAAGATLLWLAAVAIDFVALLMGMAFRPGPTSGQVAFFHAAIGLVPAVGFANVFIGRGSIRRRASYGAKACAGVLALLVLSALCAWLAFPEYPTCGPHEALVLLMLAPTVISALALVAWPHCRRKDITAALLPLAGIAVGGALVLASDYTLFRQTMRNAVPFTTTELCYVSYYEIRDINEFAVMARVEPHVAQSIIESLQLQSVAGPIEAPSIRGADTGWWTPPPHDRHWSHVTRPDQPREDWEGCSTAAVYVGGYLYIAESCNFL